MEDIYVNVEYDKPAKSNIHKRKSADLTGPRSSERRSHSVGLCLGLLSVFLLAGLIGLGVTYAELYTVKANLTERLQISDNKFSSLIEERDLLKVNRAEMTKEMNRLNAELNIMKVILAEHLQTSDNKVTSLTEERDLLKVNLTEMTKEMNRLICVRERTFKERIPNPTMEDIYVNVEYDKPDKSNIIKRKSTNQTDPKSSERRSHSVGLCLGLLSVFLLAGLIGLGVIYAELSTVKANLTERLHISDNKFSSLTEERDLLKVNLTEMTEELYRLNAELSTFKANLIQHLQTSDNNTNLTEMIEELNRLKRTCPAGWTTFTWVCYFLSTASGSWEKGREDCRDRGADLVVISSTMEQDFLTAVITQDTWIGLNDRENEGTWKWTDGTPLTRSYWAKQQPDNGDGNPKWGEEDCVHLLVNRKSEENWNDRRCSDSLRWICEKMA